EVEEQTVELVGPIRGNGTTYGARHAGLGFDVVGARVLEPGAEEPPGGGIEPIVPCVERDARPERRVMPVVDRRIRTPGLVVAEHRPRVAGRDGRLQIVAQLEVDSQ